MILDRPKTCSWGYRSILIDLHYLVVREERWGVGDATCDPAGCSDVTLEASTSGAEQRNGARTQRVC